MIVATTFPVKPAGTGGGTSASAAARPGERARAEAGTAGFVGGVLEVAASAVEIANVVASDIAAFVHHPAGSTSLGRRVAEAVNTVLLGNGWAFTGLSDSPLALSAGPASGDAGDGWSAWRAAADGARELQGEDGLWRALGGIDVDTTPKDVGELAGTYRRLDVAAVDWSTITRRTSVVLAADGTFSRARSTSVMGGGIGTLHAPAAVSSWTLDAPELVATDDNGVALVDASRDGHLFGTYHALEDGVTVEFRYANGHVEQRLLFATGDDRRVLGTRSTRFDATSVRHVLYGAEALAGGGRSWATVLGGAPDSDGKRREKEDDKSHVRKAIERTAGLENGGPELPARVDPPGARWPP